MRNLLPFLFAFSCGLPSLALAQAEVVGVYYNGTSHKMYSSTTSDFVGDWAPVASSNPQFYHCMDFNAAATELYAIHFFTGDFGTIDPVSGAFTSLGTPTLPSSQVQGLTAHPDGVTWYAITKSGADSQLYEGSMTTGVFTPIGSTVSGLYPIDLACDRLGRLFTYSTVNDNLYELNPLTGVPTVVGPIGLNLEYAQGFDFDWWSNELYATVSLSLVAGGGSKFVRLDTTTGAATVLADADALYDQAEMAIRRPAPVQPKDVSPFCDPAELNSTGFSTFLVASLMPGSGTSIHFDASHGPPDEFGVLLVGSAADPVGIPLSFGRLCLSTAPGEIIGRYNIVGTPLNSIGIFDSLGDFQNLSGTSTTGYGYDLPVELPFIGSPLIMIGESWSFQLWHRDGGFGVGASTLSNGVTIEF